MSELIKGNLLAKKIKEELKIKTIELKKQGITPKLAVILVGNDPASQIYVNHKEKDAKEIGFLTENQHLDETITQEELLSFVQKYNEDSSVHGILVQLPMPSHINSDEILLAIDPKKDVDGFHPMNMGRLLLGNPQMIPSTPHGIMKMFEEYDIELEGKNAVIIGRSNIVGKPMSVLLTAKNATVTLAHSKTKDLAKLASTADILIVAIGVAQMVDETYIKPGAVVIDVGMNRNAAGKLVGDVSFEKVEPIASFITPVPGGVGPMTRAMLMEQTYLAAKNSIKG
ncbi:MAG: bifunctional methylenetetrahydrofolate dehydrogenase/methenyltetrahydrofolate cyclohydrolase FolD [Streptococcaceae bacterium]|jgi:methylenetetrahydrofolate dehydrogenase (NADP+)/methenyltetrahydrofolate cyclohydrolase|nr:bifunctional methylenetetrahydrofolate dehydrogenase/methenyltetrahydrofolate cyclohydrolase FolD [Streptococcaceae bacterium]